MAKGMSWRTVGKHLNFIASRVSPSLGKVVFDPKMSVMVAEVNHRFDGPLTFTVGVKELVESPNKVVPMSTAVIPIVNAFHEICGHGGQIAKEFDKHNALSLTLALNYYACKASSYYYGVDDNDNPHARYFKQPHEVAAQYMGVKMAFSYFSAVYGVGNAEGMLLSYLDYRVRNCSEFISEMPKNRSVDSVLSSLNDSYKMCVYHRHEYDVFPGFEHRRGLSALRKQSSPDLSTFALESSDFAHMYAVATGVYDLPGVIKDCNSGVKQDAMLASTLFAVSETWRRGLNSRVFDGIDMRPVIVFRRFGNVDLPKSRDSYLDLKLLDTFDDAFMSNVSQRNDESDDFSF